jgi:hypothetical protein
VLRSALFASAESCTSAVLATVLAVAGTASLARAQERDGTAASSQSPPAPAAQVTTKTEEDEASIAHLPAAVQRDIASWRERLTQARCLKVVCDTDQTWDNLHELEGDGRPRRVRRERFSMHAWMMPRSIWLVVFPYKGDDPDTSTPVFQQYWSAERSTAWERTWWSESKSYNVRRYPCDEPFGPTSPRFDSKGCMIGGIAESWLAGPRDLAGRCITARSMALMRRPELAMVSPETDQPGLWLDVFSDTEKRNQEQRGGNSFYHRQDLMLLARNEAGAPELREWRTIVVVDPAVGGQKAQRITQTSRFSYQFLDAAPEELATATTRFAADIEHAIGK